jgi:hypothetical protein
MPRRLSGKTSKPDASKHTTNANRGNRMTDYSHLQGKPADVPPHFAGEIAAEEGVRRAAKRIADSIIADARNIEGPIVWVTGNSYMPPLRSFSDAEEVYQGRYPENGGGYWEFLVEELERLLSDAGVILDCPEDDNALFAVDARRWEFDEEMYRSEEMHDLSDEYRRI